MRLPLYLVDAFASDPFTGNPAAVVPLSEPLDDDLMQRIAMEMNQAETAFVLPDMTLRWLTPTVEVDLCGHATLATAHVLWQRGATGTLRFSTRSGILTAEQSDAGIVLDFPAEAPSSAALPHALPFLGETVWTGRNRMDWFVQVADEEMLRSLVPDFALISALGIRGLIVTAAGEDVDFVSRCFFPQSGVPEDPVTGSAHCALAPFWAERLGESRMTGYQASRRGGTVGVEVVGDRVRLTGRAITTVEGELCL
ncbi:PhzF family phenazine biosynthesis protein [bacterium]|nr:MAG: PhzF family phenazine biosynthesis protein [bacterium]